MANPNPKRENLAQRFQPGQSGNPNGRPRNRVKEFRERIMGKKKAKKYFGISAFEVTEWYEALITMDLPDLKLLAADDTAPALARTYARAIIFDMNAGKTTTIDKLTAKLHGKAIQRIELTGANGSDIVAPRTLTKEEAKEFIGELEKDY